VQRERRNQVEQQLQADVIAPAAAACQQAQAQAKGEAASIIEDGRARAEGLRALAATWQAAGDNAREIFLFQKLESLLSDLVDTVPQVNVEKITVIDASGGTNATKMAAFLEQLKQGTGLDVSQALQSLGSGSNPPNNSAVTPSQDAPPS
jgi:flotillin